MKGRIVAGLLFVELLIVPSSAQMPVIDHAALLKWLDQIAEAKKRLNELNAINQSTIGTLNQLRWNARYLFSKYRWKAAFNSWRYPAYSNRSGKMNAYPDAVKKGIGVLEAIMEITERLPDVIDRNASFGSVEVEDIKRRHFAKVEQHDGVQALTLGTIGDVRAVQEQRSAATAELELQALSDAPEENTETALLNKQLGAHLIMIRMQQDAIKLQSAAAEMELQRHMRERDMLADEMRTEVAFQRGHGQTVERAFGGMTAAMRSYRGF